METMEEHEEQTGNIHHQCRRFRECNNQDCIFYEGDGPCWTEVSPFKLRRRPSLLLRDTAEHCLCLSMPCTECDFFQE